MRHRHGALGESRLELLDAHRLFGVGRPLVRLRRDQVFCKVPKLSVRVLRRNRVDVLLNQLIAKIVRVVEGHLVRRGAQREIEGVARACLLRRFGHVGELCVADIGDAIRDRGLGRRHDLWMFLNKDPGLIEHVDRVAVADLGDVVVDISDAQSVIVQVRSCRRRPWNCFSVPSVDSRVRDPAGSCC